MLIDMHCHSKEGSLDGCISVQDYETGLTGFDGILITDHSSYEGYDTYMNSNKHNHTKQRNFKIFKGIEYDTSDAGHIIVILPTKVDGNFLTLRGMPVRHLIKLVHHLGGVLGAAHPFDYYRLGMGNLKKWYHIKNIDVWAKLDFIEGFNSICTPLTNKLATKLANHLGIICTSGSDTHRRLSLGTAGTVIDDNPNTEDDLIEIIKSKNKDKFRTWEESRLIDKTLNKQHKILSSLGAFSCSLNNKMAYLFNKSKFKDFDLIINRKGGCVK